MRIKSLTYLCCVIMLFACSSVFAKKGPPPPQNAPPINPGLPIDGGLSYLLIVGAAYGVYAIRKKFMIEE